MQAQVCRTTLIPSQSLGAPSGGGGSSSESPLSSQSVTLGDHLIGISADAKIAEASVLDEFVDASGKDLHVFFGTPTYVLVCLLDSSKYAADALWTLEDVHLTLICH